MHGMSATVVCAGAGCPQGWHPCGAPGLAAGLQVCLAAAACGRLQPEDLQQQAGQQLLQQAVAGPGAQRGGRRGRGGLCGGAGSCDEGCGPHGELREGGRLGWQTPHHSVGTWQAGVLARLPLSLLVPAGPPRGRQMAGQLWAANCCITSCLFERSTLMLMNSDHCVCSPWALLEEKSTATVDTG